MIFYHDDVESAENTLERYWNTFCPVNNFCLLEQNATLRQAFYKDKIQPDAHRLKE